MNEGVIYIEWEPRQDCGYELRAAPRAHSLGHNRNLGEVSFFNTFITHQKVSGHPGTLLAPYMGAGPCCPLALASCRCPRERDTEIRVRERVV